MKILEPVKREDIPCIKGRGKYDGIYDRAESLNGLALPVECETMKEAVSLAQSGQGKGKGSKRGFTCARRGTTVFVYKKS